MKAEAALADNPDNLRDANDAGVGEFESRASDVATVEDRKRRSSKEGTVPAVQRTVDEDAEGVFPRRDCQGQTA